MMNTRLSKSLVALLAVAAVGACDEPPIEPGNSDPARLFTSASVVVVEAGESRQVRAYLVNDQSNPVVGDVEFSACSGAVSVAADPTQTDIEPGTSFIVTGVTLGETCVRVSGGDFEETITVRVVPGGLALTLADTLLSGSTVAGSVVFEDATGQPATGFDLGQVTFVSLDEDIAVVDAQGNVTAQAPGTGRVAVILNEGLGAPRADTVTFTVVPGTFTGTMTPGSAEPGDTVTFTAGTSGFDETTTLTFGGEPALIVSQTETEIVAVVPFGGIGEFLLTGLGEGEVASAGTYTTTATDHEDPFEEGDADEGRDAPPMIDLPGSVYASVDPGNADDFFAFTISAEDAGTYDMTVSWWEEDADIDIFLFPAAAPFTCAADLFRCGAATTANPEGGEVTLVPGTYHLYVNLWDAHGAGVVTYEVKLE